MPEESKISQVIETSDGRENALAAMFFVQHGEPYYGSEDFKPDPDGFLRMEGGIHQENTGPIREWTQRFWTLWQETMRTTINFRISPKRLARDTLKAIMVQLTNQNLSLVDQSRAMSWDNLSNWEFDNRLSCINMTPGLHECIIRQVKGTRKGNGPQINRLNAWVATRDFQGSETPEEVYRRSMSFLQEAIKESKREEHSGLFVNICHPENVRDLLAAANLDINEHGMLPLPNYLVPNYLEEVFVGVLPYREADEGYPLQVIFREQEAEIIFHPQTGTIAGYTPR
ncbi:hypothetical protein ACFL0Z_01925 [Patescibacteria group bacterium]